MEITHDLKWFYIKLKETALDAIIEMTDIFWKIHFQMHSYVFAKTLPEILLIKMFEKGTYD